MSEKEKLWFAARIEINADAAEAVEFALNESNALGTEINNLGRDEGETVTVVGYFDAKPDEEFLRTQISEALRIYNFPLDTVKKVEFREVENQDWLAEWKKHWKPTETEKFIVAPTWTTIEKTEKMIIRIEPSMAFGTGTHETTRLCLRAIEENYSPEMSLLDVGTGTGILAVGAAKIQGVRQESKGKIWACDTDADSVSIARENAAMNETNDIEFYVGSITEKTPQFDFVCANLTVDVILPLLPLLLGKTKQILVLSGILREQEETVTNELKNSQISNFQIEIDGEWISIEVRSEE